MAMTARAEPATAPACPQMLRASLSSVAVSLADGVKCAGARGGGSWMGALDRGLAVLHRAFGRAHRSVAAVACTARARADAGRRAAPRVAVHRGGGARAPSGRPAMGGRQGGADRGPHEPLPPRPHPPLATGCLARGHAG